MKIISILLTWSGSFTLFVAASKRWRGAWSPEKQRCFCSRTGTRAWSRLCHLMPLSDGMMRCCFVCALRWAVAGINIRPRAHSNRVGLGKETTVRQKRVADACAGFGRYLSIRLISYETTLIIIYIYIHLVFYVKAAPSLLTWVNLIPRPNHWAQTRHLATVSCTTYQETRAELQRRATTVAIGRETPTRSEGSPRCNPHPHLVCRDFNVRRRHGAVGHRDETPAPTWAITTSIGGAPPLISTGSGASSSYKPSSDFNWQRRSSDFNWWWHEIQFHLVAAQLQFQAAVARDLIST
jgi:hypothetical protein